MVTVSRVPKVMSPITFVPANPAKQAPPQRIFPADAGLTLDTWLKLAATQNKPDIHLCSVTENKPYSNISADNPIFEYFELESLGENKETVEKALSIVNEIIGRVKKIFQAAKAQGLTLTPQQQLSETFAILTQDLHIGIEDLQYLYKGLTNPKPTIDCDTSSFLFISIGHELHWPLSTISCLETTPNGVTHVFLKWNATQPQATFYFEATSGECMAQYTDNPFYNAWPHKQEGTIDQFLGFFYTRAAQWQALRTNYLEATRLYTIAIQKDEVGMDMDLVYFNRSASYYNAQYYTEALPDIQKVLLKYPANKTYQTLYQSILFNLASIEKKYTEALEYIHTLLKLDPNNEKYLYLRNGTLYNRAYDAAMSGKYTEAMLDTQRLLSYDPKNDKYLQLYQYILYYKAIAK